MTSRYRVFDYPLLVPNPPPPNPKISNAFGATNPHCGQKRT